MSRACLLVLHAELEGTPRQEPQRLALRVLRVHMRHLQPQRSARLALHLTFRYRWIVFVFFLRSGHATQLLVDVLGVFSVDL